MPRTGKVLSGLGSILLLGMAIFHGSGYAWVSAAISESNAPEFLEDVVPVLFAHVSIHLVGLAAFGILSLFLGHGARRMLAVLAVVVAADALLGFFLGGIAPGALLLTAALCFALAAARPRVPDAESPSHSAGS